MGYVKSIAVALALAGCTPTAQAAFDAASGQAVESVKHAEDSKARLALIAPCAMTVGAYNRLADDAKQRAVMALCGGSAERPVTVDDLQRFLARPSP